MTRTDVMASSRPLSAGSASEGTPRTHALRTVASAFAAILVALTLVPAVALAATEPTSGYKQTPTTTTPTTGVSPSKEKEAASTTPAKETEPTKTTAPAAEKASTLPFTGMDLRWELAIGLLLIAGGVAVVLAQRRQRPDGR